MAVAGGDVPPATAAKKIKGNKNMRKLLVFALAVITAMSACLITSCGEEPDDLVQVDTSKSQIYIGNYDGGVGSAWIKAVGDNFEKTYAETSFEEGKKGVQVIINNSKNIDGGTIGSIINTSTNEVWFTEQIYYYSLLNGKEYFDGEL